MHDYNYAYMFIGRAKQEIDKRCMATVGRRFIHLRTFFLEIKLLRIMKSKRALNMHIVFILCLCDDKHMCVLYIYTYNGKLFGMIHHVL